LAYEQAGRFDSGVINGTSAVLREEATMAAPKKHSSQEWQVFDLLELGKRGKEESQYLKAVPVIILDKWVREGRVKGAANHIKTKYVADRLKKKGLHGPFKPKASSNVLTALKRMQEARNLTKPYLIASMGGGEFEVNLPHYEKLLEDYRQEYSKEYKEDYKLLFPKAEDEPDWGQPSPPEAPVEQDWISDLLAPLEKALRENEQARVGLTKEREELRARNEELTHKIEQVQSKKQSLDANKRVFVVHGHDSGLVAAVEAFCYQLELKPITLQEEPSGGSTVIEKLEKYADAAFAIVLLTPDDVGSVKGDEQHPKPRARQNVILELGYFMASLGRKQTCALVTDESLEMPSDYKGVVYILVDKPGAWKTRLAKEMQSVGLPVDLNKIKT
jgi:predicted nucleotide-binding protein